MKKVLVALLVVVMVMALPMTAFAAGAFLSSPSSNADTELVDVTFSDGCTAQVVLTPYGDRVELDDDARKLLEEAYKQISENKDLSKIVDSLKELADKLGVDSATLVVSDLFNVDYVGCDDHEDHTYTVKLQPEVIKNFVTVMQLVDGKWVIVENARVEGEYLIMTSGNYGPTAIVVEGDSPVMGDSFSWIYVVLMAVSVVGLITVSVLYKKKSV